MKKCPHCSEENNSSAKFCRKCGKEMSQPDSAGIGEPSMMDFASQKAVRGGVTSSGKRPGHRQTRAIADDPVVTRITNVGKLKPGSDIICPSCSYRFHLPADSSPSPPVKRDTPLVQGPGPKGSKGAHTQIFRRGEKPWAIMELYEEEPIGEPFPLKKNEVKIGRAEGDCVYEDDDLMSECHILIEKKIRVRRPRYTLKDLDSEIGTFVKLPPEEVLLLEEGTEFLIGQQRLRYQESEVKGARGGIRWELVQLSMDNEPIEAPHRLNVDSTTIGRDESCNIRFGDDIYCSKIHATVLFRGDDQDDEEEIFVLHDLGSKTGIYYRIQEKVLKIGDRFLAGNHEFLVGYTDSFGTRPRS